MREKILQDKNKPMNMLFFCMFAMGVIALRIFYITRTTGPFIYADEFGYWSHAAHMTGNTWAGVMDGVSWYSFGYSFWLALTFLFSNRMVVMFRTAVLINALMGLGTYALAYGVIRKLVCKQGVFACGFLALVVTSFPTYVFYSYTTMSETLISLLVWLTFFEVLSLEEKPSWWKGMLLGFTLGYAYMVHNRMLTVILAAVICVAALWITHKIDWKVVAALALSVVVMLLLYALIKGYLQSMIVENQMLSDTGVTVSKGTANTFGRIFSKFIRIFSLENIRKPLLNVMGQLWQCLSSTYLLLGIGVVFCIRNLMKSLKLRQWMCAYAYPILAILFSIGMTGTAAYGNLPRTAGRVRIDGAFYGRYNECLFPLFIMMALIMILEGETRDIIKVYLGVAVVYLCLSVGMFFRLYGIENGYLNIVSSVGTHIFHWLGEFSVWKCCLIALLGGTVIVALCTSKLRGKWGYYGGLFVLLFLFSTTALYCMRTSIHGENEYTNLFAPMYDYLNQNTEKKEIVYTCDENKAAFDLQSRLVDKAVVCTVPEQLDKVVGEAYVVVRENQMEELNITDYEICLECEGYIVLRVNEN